MTAIADEGGTIVERYRYSAYGQPAIFTAAFGTISGTSYGWRYLYTGRLFDVNTGLQENRRRWYNLVVGQWLSRDPVDFQANDTNLYRYCKSEPNGTTDPVGLDTYRIARGIGNSYPSLEGKASPSHEFNAETDANGKVTGTQSWGNNFNPQKDPYDPSFWYPDQREDIKAAQRAINTGLADKVGDSSLDPYMRQAFDMLRGEGADSPSSHKWGERGLNCKHEADRQVKLAKDLRKADREAKTQEEYDRLRWEARQNAGFGPEITGVPPVR